MTNPPGNPATNIAASSGWSLLSRRADGLAGLNTELRFHLDSDTTVNFAGLAIDDVSVTACRVQTADVAITKTDGVATATPGGSVTYTITASNAGPDAVPGGSVADTFPAAVTCAWTCAGAGGGTCTAAGSGNINDAVGLPVGGSATYTATCTIAASATGNLANTATVAGGAISDPTPGNNTATDTDTLTPVADLSVVKTGPTFAQRGADLRYTIVVANAGPSDGAAVQVADPTPAGLGFVSNAGDCTTPFPCALGAVAPGASRTITTTYVVPAGHDPSAPIVNTAAVSGSTTDPDPANDTSSATSRFGAFYSLAPCRLVDTRAASSPALQPGEQRTFDLTGPCGVPIGAVALSVNMTVTLPAADGRLRLFPTGAPLPLTSTINFSAAQTRANNGVLLVAADGSAKVTVLNSSAGTVEFLLDVNGYFE